MIKKSVVDLKDKLYGTIFEPLKDKKLFASVRLDADLDINVLLGIRCDDFTQKKKTKWVVNL